MKKNEVIKPKKAKLGTYLKRNYDLYLMLLPTLIFVLIFDLAPMYGILLAFKDYNMFAAETPFLSIIASEFSVIFIFQCSQCLDLILCTNIQITHCCGQLLMTKKNRYFYNIHSFFQPMHCPCMPKLVCMQIQWHIATFNMSFTCVKL